MFQLWYTGPIAKAGPGDIGILTGIVVGATLYAKRKHFWDADGAIALKFEYA